MQRLIDLTGKKFGRLVVIKEIKKRSKSGKVLWKCLCDCGNYSVVRSYDLKSGGTKSCGCYNLDRITTHGMSKHKCFKTWDGMMRRCYSEKHMAYYNYGGRGISVVIEWRESPKIFIEWLINNGWKKGLEIDRIDNNGNYSPENCRIVTTIENHNNTRCNRRFIACGENLTVSEASRKYKIRYSTIMERLKRGWTGNRAVSAVKHGNGKD